MKRLYICYSNLIAFFKQSSSYLHLYVRNIILYTLFINATVLVHIINSMVHIQSCQVQEKQTNTLKQVLKIHNVRQFVVKTISLSMFEISLNRAFIYIFIVLFIIFYTLQKGKK